MKKRLKEINGKATESSLSKSSSQEATYQHKTPVQSLVAKKSFIIRQAPYERVIRAGEDISDVPAKYHPNLRTEGVL